MTITELCRARELYEGNLCQVVAHVNTGSTLAGALKDAHAVATIVKTNVIVNFNGHRIVVRKDTCVRSLEEDLTEQLLRQGGMRQ